MKARTRQQSPANIVRALTREELEAFLLSQLELDDGALASAILARFGRAKGKDEWLKLVRECRRNHSDGSYGIVDDADNLALDLEELRTKAKQMKGKDSANKAFALYTAIVEAIAPNVYDADDHDGILLEIVSNTLADIRALAKNENTATNCLSEMRTWARANIESKWAEEGDSWDYDLFEIDLAAGRGKEELDSSLKLCESKCLVKNNNEFHEEYLANKLAELVCSALIDADDSERLQSFITNHLDRSTVRDVAIRRARESRDWETAERLAHDGMILSAKQKFFGNENRYALELIAILDARGKFEIALELAEDRTVKAASMDWYREIVKRVPDLAGRRSITDRLLADVVPVNKELAADICAFEQRWEELNAMAAHNASIMERHYRVLGKHYPKSVALWLEKVIRSEFKTASTRGMYRIVASRIPDLCLVSGKTAVQAFVNDLIFIYSNRPAMIEELRKVI